MVSTRTTAQSQREVQRLDCSVPGLWLSWLLVVHIVRPLGVALVLYWKQRAWRGQGAAVAGGRPITVETVTVCGWGPRALLESPRRAQAAQKLGALEHSRCARLLLLTPIFTAST
jgi:hypothetical protein